MPTCYSQEGKQNRQLIKKMDLSRNGDANELLQAQAHIWNRIFNFINSMSLKCAIQLGIPDIIHKHCKPMTLDELTNALPIGNAKAPFVYRLMRILIHSGFFIEAKISQHDEEEGYMLTSSSKLLLKDEPLSLTAFLLSMLDPTLMDPWYHLSQWFQNYSDVNPFKTCHGKVAWELAGQDQKLNNFFNEGMASDSRLVGSILIRDCKDVFSGLNSLVDVGANNKNLAFVGGDMFVAIPPADAVIMKWILHDWNDEECIQILKKCKEVIPSKQNGGRAIIIDMVLNDQQKGADDDEAIETQLFFNMLMMVLVTGKQRNEKERAKLFSEVGFNDYKITSVLGLRSLIKVYY
ncbi:unnamed protein product [Coffea canephora]|uniref:DH200=94 genomic scaffold, scaffold_5086 n=1 Tax=Coffea canephora TaxID=49390 RepID=A0A068VLU1_COFCA|nr:unnamed protein product [Coffea canephora]